jgi:hypothetical protein
LKELKKYISLDCDEVRLQNFKYSAQISMKYNAIFARIAGWFSENLQPMSNFDFGIQCSEK